MTLLFKIQTTITRIKDGELERIKSIIDKEVDRRIKRSADEKLKDVPKNDN